MATKVYKYGARKPELNMDLVDDQFYYAHAYRNSLCRLEPNHLARVASMISHLPSQELSWKDWKDGGE